MIKVIYRQKTDLNMNSIFIPILPKGYFWNSSVSECYIQGYQDGSYDVILERYKDGMTMQGCFFNGEKQAVIITGFKILPNSIRIHFKISKKSRSLISAKKALNKMVSSLVGPL